MILIGVVYGAIAGKMAEVTNAALDSAGDAVSLCITMIGVMALWVGLMEIAQKASGGVCVCHGAGLSGAGDRVFRLEGVVWIV